MALQITTKQTQRVNLLIKIVSILVAIRGRRITLSGHNTGRKAISTWD